MKQYAINEVGFEPVDETQAMFMQNLQPIESVYYGGLKGGRIYPNALKDGQAPLMKAGHAWMQKDRYTESEVQATSTTYTSTSGSITMFPLYIETGILDYTIRDHPLYVMFQKKQVRGKFLEYNYRSTKPTAAFRYERAGQPESDDTLARLTVEIKFAYAVGKIQGPAMAVWNSLGYNILQEEINTQREALLDLIEQAIISGDASSNAYEFSGMDTLISSCYINKSSAAVGIDDIRLGIRYAKQRSMTSVAGTGRPNLMVTNYATYDQVKALLMPWERYNDTTLMNWGITSIVIDGIPMIVDPFASVTANSKVIYILDMSTWEMGVLKDITYKQLPADGDFDKFMLSTYLCLNCKDEAGNCRIYGIA